MFSPIFPLQAVWLPNLTALVFGVGYCAVFYAHRAPAWRKPAHGRAGAHAAAFACVAGGVAVVSVAGGALSGMGISVHVGGGGHDASIGSSGSSTDGAHAAAARHAQDVIGIVGCAICIVMFGAPLAAMATVVRERVSQSIYS